MKTRRPLPLPVLAALTALLLTALPDRSAEPCAGEAGHTGLSTGAAQIIVDTEILAALEANDGDLGNWQLVAPMPLATSEFGAAAIDGLVYGAGGFGSGGDALLIYDPRGDSWTRGSDMPRGTDHPGVATVDGKLYVIGGSRSKTLVQIYDPVTDSWSYGAEMPTARTALALGVLSGRIHAVGGATDIHESDSMTTHEVYDPEVDRWTTAAPLPEPVEHLTAGVIERKLYAVGGRIGFANRSFNQIYDPATDSWTPGARLPTSRSGMALAVLDDRLYVGGGENLLRQISHAENERYDPVTNTWESLEPLPLGLHGVSAVSVGSHVYFLGGAPIAGDAGGSDTMLRFTPPRSFGGRPAEPSNLRGKVRSPTEILLRWNYNSDNETSFVVQMKPPGGRFKKIAKVATDVRKLAVSDLIPGAVYTFRVRAKAGKKKSPWSERLTISTPSG